MTLGREPGNTIRFDDPSVSRRHARITRDGGRVVIADLGSSEGTWVDGTRITGPAELTDGSQIRLGDQALAVERQRGANESSVTMVVPDRTTARGDAAAQADHPRLRSGYALKRLPASEVSRRYVLKDLRNGSFIRMASDDVRLVALLDGSRSVSDLVVEAEGLLGDSGGASVARLLAELGDRGLLDGVEGRSPQQGPAGVLRPRDWDWRGAADAFEGLYRAGGRWLVSPWAIATAAVLIAAGLVLFPYLVFARYGTPFVVAKHVGLGGAVFLLGRLVISTIHETAHAMALASFGRRAGRAGVKLVLVFPYFFVDTSDAWFERRNRRIAISAAGPASDLALAGAFSLGSLVVHPGGIRDVLFQLAFAAYVGGLLNLNPFLERDGYHMLVDLLGEPQLRQRAQAELRSVLRGQAPPRRSVLTRYAIGVIVWSTVAAAFAVVLSLRYQPVLAAALPTPLAWAVLGICWIAFFAPVVLLLARAIARGSRHGAP